MNAYTASQIAQHKAHKDRTARLWLTPKPYVINNMIDVLEAAKRRKAAMQVQQDFHVTEWRIYKSKEAMSPARAYLWLRCREIGASWEEIVSGNRKHEIVNTRHRLVWECVNKFELSFPAIGRIFAMDHTSIMYIHQKWEMQEKGIDVTQSRIGAPMKMLSPEEVEEIGRMYMSKIAIYHIRDKFKISPARLERIVKANKWVNEFRKPPMIKDHDPEIIEGIGKAFMSGLSIKTTADMFGVTRHSVTRYRNRFGWKKPLDALISHG